MDVNREYFRILSEKRRWSSNIEKAEQDIQVSLDLEDLKGFVKNLYELQNEKLMVELDNQVSIRNAEINFLKKENSSLEKRVKELELSVDTLMSKI